MALRASMITSIRFAILAVPSQQEKDEIGKSEIVQKETVDHRPQTLRFLRRGRLIVVHSSYFNLHNISVFIFYETTAFSSYNTAKEGSMPEERSMSVWQAIKTNRPRRPREYFCFWLWLHSFVLFKYFARKPPYDQVYLTIDEVARGLYLGRKASLVFNICYWIGLAGLAVSSAISVL